MRKLEILFVSVLLVTIMVRCHLITNTRVDISKTIKLSFLQHFMTVVTNVLPRGQRMSSFLIELNITHLIKHLQLLVKSFNIFS